MTKTLTEKWKDRELNEGEYYCKITESPYIEKVHLPCLGDAEFVIEVLAPVPSYEELREKEVIYNTTSRCNETLLWENESLKNKVGKLKEQLKEANEVINNMKLCMNDKYDYDCVAEDVDVYREKWDVK